jgi:hypothetical protein
MAEKLPTIIDNRGDNTLLHALQRLLPGVQGLDITTGLFEILRQRGYSRGHLLKTCGCRLGIHLFLGIGLTGIVALGSV